MDQNGENRNVVDQDEYVICQANINNLLPDRNITA